MAALSLFELVAAVLSRRHGACEDEVGDERFVAAVAQVLRAKVLTPREVRKVEEELRRRLRPRGAGPSGAVENPAI